MVHTYTARYTKIDSGYMGQLVEWPEVITDGKTLDEMLRDALHEMILAYQEDKLAIPAGSCLLEPIPVEI
jgi:predicted RNase H-like HicB family nuclease